MAPSRLPTSKHIRVVLPTDADNYFQLLANLMEMGLDRLLFLPWDMVHGSFLTDFQKRPRPGSFRTSTRGSADVYNVAVVREVYAVAGEGSGVDRVDQKGSPP